MKRYVFFLLLSFFIVQISHSQEWMTSLDAAKRIALIQDKFLFMIWEDAAKVPYPVIGYNARGHEIVYDDMLGNKEINELIWKYFVPVKVSESAFAQLYDQAKIAKSKAYMAQLEDDNIKIMDVNCTILNTSISPPAYFNLSNFIGRYALNTSFLTGELKGYSEHPSFNTAFRLGSKYMDYSILVDPVIRKDVLRMSEMYLDEAVVYLSEGEPNDILDYQMKIDLLRLTEYLIVDRPRKVLRKLKRIDSAEIEPTNASQYAFLYYTAYLLRNDKKNTEVWESKVSLVNLKKARLIANLHI